jgi:hypothetical protein
MIEPMMNATPPRKNSCCQTRTAASTFSARPVSEIAFGVRRESISRLRIIARVSVEESGEITRRSRLAGRSVTGGVLTSPGPASAARFGRARAS